MIEVDGSDEVATYMANDVVQIHNLGFLSRHFCFRSLIHSGPVIMLLDSCPFVW